MLPRIAPRLRSLVGTEFVRLCGLLSLCLVLSVLTLREQHDADAGAGHQLARRVLELTPGQVLVVIPVSSAAHGATPAHGGPAPSAEGGFEAFVQAAVSTLQQQHITVHIARGDAREVRKVLVSLQTTGQPLGAILTTHEAAQWLLFEDLPVDFPALGSPPVLSPQAYRWPDFLKARNLFNIADQIAVIAIVAIGMTLVIITGGIDLSIGSLIALSSVTSCLLIQDYGGGVTASSGMMVACSLAGIAAAASLGVLNGLLITQLRMPPFIVTLSTMLAVSGVAYMLTGGESAHRIPPAFTWLGRGRLGGIPNSVVLLGVLYAVAHFVMKRTTGGRYLYAVGGNREASRLSGIRTERVLLAAYVCSGLLAGFGGVLMASQLQSGSPMFGQMYELYVIAAVVVGGTSLTGGRGTMLGTLIGAFFIAVIQNGMNLLRVESYLQKVVLGLVILAAVGIDQRRGRAGER
jgi:ribose transport system permease protein